MRPIATFAVLASLALAPSVQPARADEPKGDLARLQGRWSTLTGPNKDVPLTLHLKGNSFEIRVKRPDGVEATLTGDLKLDETADPKTFAFVNFKGPQGREIGDNLGLYKFADDIWTTCMGGPGNDRPSKFEAANPGPPVLSNWTRVKDGDAGADKPIPGDLGKLQGVWSASAGPNGDVSITMTVKVNAYTATWDRGDGTKVVLKGELRVNESATPRKTVDFFNTRKEDDEPAKDSLGIYEFDGDKVKFCVGDPGEERPTEFKGGGEGPPHLLVFSKKKD